MPDLVNMALEFGFSHAATLDASTLELRSEVRDMCSADKCKKFGKSWMCPPACGTLEENRKRLAPYRAGLIVQTTGEMEDDFDIEVIEETGSIQKRRFQAFTRELKKQYPNLLPLTSGACELCAECSYPNAPCLHPDEAVPSMEAFGLVVSDVCRTNNLPYYYGPRTITYTGCFLLD